MTLRQDRPIPAGQAVPLVLKLSDWSRHLRWWKPEAGIPRRCPECNAHLTVEPPAGQLYGRVWCPIGCGREYAFVSAAGWQL
jgi:hypothetical protein